MDEQKRTNLRVTLPLERVQFRFRIYASQVPSVFSKASVSLVSTDGSEVVASTNESAVRAGNCRWKETLKYEGSFAGDGSDSPSPHVIKFVVSEKDAEKPTIGEVDVDLSEFSQAESGMLEQKSFTLTNENGEFSLHLTVQCSSMPSPSAAGESTPTPTPIGNKVKGLISLLRRTSSNDNFSLPEHQHRSESTTTPDSASATHAKEDQKAANPESRHKSLELDADTSTKPGAPIRKSTSDKYAHSRPHRASSVPVRFVSENFLAPEEPLPANVEDLRAELKKAEEAIDELQSESVVWRKASRTLSKEVENLRQQLAEAMKQDQLAEMEINSLVEERDYLTYELEKSHSEADSMDNEIADLKIKLKDMETDLIAQKADVARLTLQVKSRAEGSNLSSPSGKPSAELEGGDFSQLEPSTSMKSDYQEAIEAIEELQAETVTWQTTSRTLSKEVEFLKKHLTEAVRNDQEAGAEIQDLVQEKEELKEELEKERYSHDITKSTVKMLEEEVSLQKEMIQVLMIQVKAFHGSSQHGMVSPHQNSSVDSKFLYSRGVGVGHAL